MSRLCVLLLVLAACPRKNGDKPASPEPKKDAAAAVADIKTPDEGRGRVEATKQGAFKTPTLRGAHLRRAFFHDASVKTFDDAIGWHLAGGVGHGADPSIVDVKKIGLSDTERAQLDAFVRALTDAMAPSTKPQLP